MCCLLHIGSLTLVCPASTGSSFSPASFFSTAGDNNRELDFLVSSQVLDQWFGSDDCLDLDGATWEEEGSRSPASHGLSGGQPPLPAPKRRGRKPGPRASGGLAVTHVEAERQRRDKLNRRFCELRAAVPTVSRMDKASLLADAAAYIAELRGCVEQLEAQAKKAATSAAAAAATVAPPPAHHSPGAVGEKLEVRMVGQDAAALRLTTAAAGERHAPARLMLALRSLDLPVQHACVCRVGGVTVQDAVVDVPAAALRDERGLRAALLSKLQRSG